MDVVFQKIEKITYFEGVISKLKSLVYLKYETSIANKVYKNSKRTTLFFKILNEFQFISFLFDKKVQNQ